MSVLAGKVAIVTGAGQGIGREIALLLAKDGADVMPVDINEAAAQKTAEEIRALGRRSEPFVVDVTKTEQVDAAVEAVRERYGRVDMLVNNAGIIRDALLHKMTDDEWDAVINVHLKGTFLFTRAVARVMREQESGSIVNLSSIAAKVGNIGQANYSAAKAGIVAFTKVAAKELARKGVRVNCVQPGIIDTDMTKGIPEKVMAMKLAEVPLQRIGQPAEVASVVRFLLGPESSYMTGAVLEVAGGRYM